MQFPNNRLLVRWAQTRTNLISDMEALAKVCRAWVSSSWPCHASLRSDEPGSPHLISCDQVACRALAAEAPAATDAVQVRLEGRVPAVALRRHVVVHDECHLKRTAAKPWHSCQ